MPVTKVNSRQTSLHAIADLSIANIGAGNEITFNLPPRSMLLNVFVDTVTAFNGTTNTVTVGDGTTTFASAVDVKTTGRETVANVGKYYPAAATITCSAAQTGAATVGQTVVVAEYVVMDRETELHYG
jgi:hypothetical protein